MGSRNLSILSANVRGFQTNIGDLTHSFIIPRQPDIIVTVETFLTETIPVNYGKVAGYSKWFRRDRKTGNFGGVAACFRNELYIQELNIDIPDHLELMFFRVWVNTSESILLCVCYRPQWQKSEPIDYLYQHLDDIMNRYACKNVIIVGDMNQHLIARSFNEFLTVYGLTNHVNFPTHISGSSLDPVLSDLSEFTVNSVSLGSVGSSDHFAISTNINIENIRDTPVQKTIWLWGKGNWKGFRSALENIDWNSLPCDNVDQHVECFTNIITQFTEKYIPHRKYISKPSDQPWFGYRCRIAADEKRKAWTRYKRRPSQYNKDLHIEACKNMENTQRWAINHWRTLMKQKLSGITVGSKTWWNIVEEQQGFSKDDAIPPLNNIDGSVVTSSVEKAESFAAFFANKMSVPDSNAQVPNIPKITTNRLSSVKITMKDVERLLLQVDVKKALGPDNISPHVLRNCAYQLAKPLSAIFNLCLVKQIWPKIWKLARVICIHKKKSKSNMENYRPVSLLSVVGKIYEKIIVEQLTSFFDKNHLLSRKQYGFRQTRSTQDLLLNLTSKWNKSLDEGKYTYVIALDIAGAFDRVWHSGLITKLQSLGIDGKLLELIRNYLLNRSLSVVIGGHTSKMYPIQASVPQGSVIGPLLWNVYFNDLLHLIPEAEAYADDCTLSFTCDDSNRIETLNKINQTLKLILIWAKRWKITLAPEKTQLLLITRKQNPLSFHLPSIRFQGKCLKPEKNINLLGVNFDDKLNFIDHVKDMAEKCGKKLAAIRRISYFLNDKGCQVLYNSQVRPIMEYASLVWTSCPPSYLRLLDKIQKKAINLIQFKSADRNEGLVVQSLQHRRDVSALCVMYKIYVLNHNHLTPLKLQSAVTHAHNTRLNIRNDFELKVPFAHTSLFMRSFIPKYCILWNRFTSEVNVKEIDNMFTFKMTVNRWKIENPCL